jgi:hypothetical protein
LATAFAGVAFPAPERFAVPAAAFLLLAMAKLLYKSRAEPVSTQHRSRFAST